MAYRGTGSKRGLQSGRPSSRDDAGHRERDTRPRGQAQPDDDEWQPKADRPGYSGRPRNDGKSGARGYDRDGFGGQRSDFDDGKDERHFEKRDPRQYRPEERDREPRARQSHYDHDRRGDKEARRDDYAREEDEYYKHSSGRGGGKYRDDRKDYNRKPQERPLQKQSEYDYHSQADKSHNYKDSNRPQRREPEYERGRMRDDQSYEAEERGGNRRKESEYSGKKGFRRDLSKDKKGLDVDNYRFNNQPNQENSRGAPHDYYKNSGGCQQGRKSGHDEEENYKFRKNQESGYHAKKQKKPSHPDDDPWMEEDSDSSEDDQGHPSHRTPSDLGRESERKVHREKGYYQEQGEKRQGEQKGWKSRVDNYGYIERKTFTKAGESNTSGVAYKGKAYYVKVDSVSGNDSKPSDKPRPQREGSSEYRVKQ